MNAISIPEAPKVSKTRANTETYGARNRRVLLQALRAGVRLHSWWGRRVNVWSPRSQHLYIVSHYADGATIYWACDADCEWARRRGTLEIYNSGTLQCSHNGVLPCGHVLVARLGRLSPERRAALFAGDPELAAAWRAAHAGRIV